eukprot:TRINITY_DN7043_c0_g1_i1.p1 TRINITY_DN7043_c0_g1~~TRINITY_DN7043_c0_g1_i1.p1  ORF type:complete len:181 (-),score=53.49 TRINITY_DN7043_c0_g1_i1:47-589(-)
MCIRDSINAEYGNNETITRMSSCRVCTFYHGDSEDATALVIGRTKRWIVRHHRGPKAPMCGWLLVDPLRHCASPADFDEDEQREFGAVVALAQKVVLAVTGCDRVYSISFGEATPHTHVHLVPRVAGDTDTESWAVADYYRAVAAGTRAAVSDDDVKATIAKARDVWTALLGDNKALERE